MCLTHTRLKKQAEHDCACVDSATNKKNKKPKGDLSILNSQYTKHWKIQRRLPCLAMPGALQVSANRSRICRMTRAAGSLTAGRYHCWVLDDVTTEPFSTSLESTNTRRWPTGRELCSLLQPKLCTFAVLTSNFLASNSAPIECMLCFIAAVA